MTAVETMSRYEQGRAAATAIQQRAGGKPRIHVRTYLDGGTSGVHGYGADWLVENLLMAVRGDGPLTWNDEGLTVQDQGRMVHVPGIRPPAGE